ncbi:MAG: pantoate--beta-alanine ligase [Polyangiaceae bacterium]|jgi:pantoate--beta-alanine ligase|nr:pantoate--beta-alanine ligase [Polyangiaceae bacterium]MBK8939394.1 pantoate--beta-alanine ligase [Polyangiaceae bacterium]
MRIVRAPLELRAACDEARASGPIAVVPTMGALHRGHAALIEAAGRRAKTVVVTVFVNPTQFGPSEDFAKYPRTLEADAELAAASGATLVFAPDADAMYSPGEETRVRVGRTAEALCGAHRPGHFEGVSTVVAKLLSLVGPSIACFGRKDYQQLRVIARMVSDLFLPIEIVAVRTVREADGLALSSRNAYLSPEDRERAAAIPSALTAAARAHAGGQRGAAVLEQLCRSLLERAVDSIDYVTLADADTVVPYGAHEQIGARALLAIAARVGGTRLIDNTVFGEEPPPLDVAGTP